MKQMNYIKLLIFNIILLSKCFSIDVNIPEDGYELSDIYNIIKVYSLKHNSININLNYDYYSIVSNVSIEIKIPSDVDISIIGKPSNSDKTVIDMKKATSGFAISFEDYTNQQIVIENIEFFNYHHERASDNTNIIYISTDKVDYNILIKNCIFNNSNSLAIKFDISGFEAENIKYGIHIDSCKFK